MLYVPENKTEPATRPWKIVLAIMLGAPALWYGIHAYCWGVAWLGDALLQHHFL